MSVRWLSLGLAAVTACVACLCATPAGPSDVDSLIHASDLVLAGTAVRMTTSPPTPPSSLDSTVVIDVDVVLRGAVAGQSVTVRSSRPIGGQRSPFLATFFGTTFRIRQYGVFFLRKINRDWQFTNPLFPYVMAAPSTLRDSENSTIERVATRVAGFTLQPDVGADDLREAIEMLSATHTPTSDQTLRRLLSHPDPDLALEAAGALLHLNDVAGLEKAASALLKPDGYSTRSLAMAHNGVVLGLNDERSVPYLAELLHASNDDTRVAAVTALARTRSPLAIPPLAKALDDANVEVQVIAVDGLSAISGQGVPSAGSAADRADALAYWRQWATQRGLR